MQQIFFHLSQLSSVRPSWTLKHERSHKTGVPALSTVKTQETSKLRTTENIVEDVSATTLNTENSLIGDSTKVVSPEEIATNSNKDVISSVDLKIDTALEQSLKYELSDNFQLNSTLDYLVLQRPTKSDEWHKSYVSSDSFRKNSMDCSPDRWIPLRIMFSSTIQPLRNFCLPHNNKFVILNNLRITIHYQ